MKSLPPPPCPQRGASPPPRPPSLSLDAQLSIEEARSAVTEEQRVAVKTTRRMARVAKPAAGHGVMVLLKVLPPDDPLRFAPSDISFASVFHSTEGEWVLPPGTYFSTAGRGGKVIEDKVRKVTIVEVVPHPAASWY